MDKIQNNPTPIGSQIQINLPENTSQEFTNFDILNKSPIETVQHNALTAYDYLNYIFFGIKTRRYIMNIEDFFDEISNPNLISQVALKAKASASYIEIPKIGEFFYKLAGQESLNILYPNVNPEIPLTFQMKREVFYGHDDDFSFKIAELKRTVQNISSYLKLNYREREESKLQDIVMIPQTELRVTEKLYPKKRMSDCQSIDFIADLNVSVTSSEIHNRRFCENYSFRLKAQKILDD
jgi:hypothetical protein